MQIGVVAAIALLGFILAAPEVSAFDAAAAFGARPSAADVSLSPDGNSVAYVAPTQGMGSVLYTVRLEEGAKPKIALVAGGKPERLAGCDWVSNDRLVCTVYGILQDPMITLVPVNRVVAVNADGSNPKLLSTLNNFYTRGLALGGGSAARKSDLQRRDWLSTCWTRERCSRGRSSLRCSGQCAMSAMGRARCASWR